MREYVKVVISAVIAVGIITSLFSKTVFSKYINLISSIIVMAVLIFPVLKISPQPLEFSATELDVQKNNYLEDEFEKNLEEKIKEQLKVKTTRDIEVKVEASIEDEVKIEEIRITPFQEEYAKIIREYLNTGENGAQIK